MIIFRKSIIKFYVQKFYVVHCMCKIAIKENFPLFHTEKLNFNAILRNQYNKFPETTTSPLCRCIINNNWNCDSYRLEQYYQPCPSTSKQWVNNGFGVYLINFNTKKEQELIKQTHRLPMLVLYTLRVLIWKKWLILNRIKFIFYYNSKNASFMLT